MDKNRIIRIIIPVLIFVIGSTLRFGIAASQSTHSIYLPFINDHTIRTDVINFYPTGLSGTPKSGYCWTNSIWLLRRDAWRCIDINQQIYDPCISPIGVTSYVVCDAHPLDNPVGFRLNLTRPLPIPGPTHPDEAADAWAMKLFDGVTCSLVQASTWPTCLPRYYCSDDLSIVNFPNPGVMWTAERGIFSIDTCSISQSEMSNLMTVWK